MRPWRTIVVCLLAGATTAARADDGAPAFPGAEGAGAHAVGGRGGSVFIVTTLADYARRDPPIAGSLRAAVEAKGPRTIVFAVSGLIELSRPLEIREPFLTIAGQTAPGDGVCLARHDLRVRDTHDIILCHLRVRPGDVAGEALDGLSVYQSRRVIIDHCSVSWSVDETLSVTGEGTDDVTVQWCFITESLNESVHHKGSHGYGSLIRADGDVSYHHNLYAHHRTRCPRPGTYGDPRGVRLDFRNNVIYDWFGPAGYTSDDPANINYVGNYLRPGPSTRDRRKAFDIGGEATRMFVEDVFLEGQPAASDPWRFISDAQPTNKLSAPIDTPMPATDTAEAAFARVLAQAGATLPARDAVDLRVVEQVHSQGGRLINSQADVGGWPNYTAAPAPIDADQDGLPDAWEKAHGLNPADPNDATRVAADGPYTHLELHLNELAMRAHPAR